MQPCTSLPVSFTHHVSRIILRNLLSSVLASHPNLPITHCFRRSPFNPALVASSQSSFARAASSLRADFPGPSFGPCRFTSLTRCSFVTAPHFKSLFGSKLQYFGIMITVPYGVTFTVNFNNNG